MSLSVVAVAEALVDLEEEALEGVEVVSVDLAVAASEGEVREDPGKCL
jgi:hypothetical protein